MKYTVVCENCKASFERIPSRLAKTNFCSRRCSTAGQKRPERELTPETLLARLEETGATYPCYLLARYFNVEAAEMKPLLAEMVSDGRLCKTSDGSQSFYAIPNNAEPVERYVYQFKPMIGHEAALRARAELMEMSR